MTKDQIRKHYMSMRMELSEAEYHSRNQQIYQRFFDTVDLSSIKTLHLFLPMRSKREPDTWLILERLRREFPHVRLVVPRVNTHTNELEHLYFEGLHQLKKNKWGIDEPQGGVPVASEKIDLVVVPLLAFDRKGHRLGYGKGYYDRFLLRCRKDCQRIGLSLFSPENQPLPAEGFDVPLSTCICPHEAFSFRASPPDSDRWR